jgi:hypothetical protein
VLAVLNLTRQDLGLPVVVLSVISHAPVRPSEAQNDPFTACIVITIASTSDRDATIFWKIDFASITNYMLKNRSY